MRIQGFKEVCDLPLIDTFTERTFDNIRVDLNCRENGVFTLEVAAYVLGYTDDATEAFQKFRNLSAYTYNEAFRYVRS